MAVELDDFYQEFFQEIHSSADAEGRYAEDAFFALFCEHLIAAGEIETADRTLYLAPRGLRIDGYGGDPAASGGVLSLIISDFNQKQEITNLTATDMDAIFKRAFNFLSKSFDPSFRNSLEETTPAFGLADLIASRWSSVSKVRLFLISNRVLSARVDGREAGEYDGRPVTYSVWDISRLHRFVASSQHCEDIEIDLEGEFGGPLTALPANLDEAGYEAYLVVIPGKKLAAIYDRWGTRLLEQNVRVFLQARSNVNKGIRNTIENDPEMFFAYNNGITVTAESVMKRMSDEGLLLTNLKNFQIVNGGQTTASIHAASRKKDIDLSKVFVQMKLSIIEPSRTEEVVPRISEYANSQNKVSAADFFSNHPFHVRFEGFSRRVLAPSPDGSFRQSKWFYERARGQYNDGRANLTQAQRKKFDLEYPKRQVFTKTDLAKFLNVWLGYPHIVSQGAQKNFAHFAQYIGRAWAKNPEDFNEIYYRHSVAKAIIFHRVEKLVMEQPWYQGGYRANIVAYAIAKLDYDINGFNRVLDFEKIWRMQGIPEALEISLKVAARKVHDVIVNPPPGMRNVTEWAKKEACWTRVKELPVTWPTNLSSVLISRAQQERIQEAGVKDQRVLNGIEAQTAVVRVGGGFWRLVKQWGAGKHLLSEKEIGILNVAGGIPGKIPSEKQCLVLIDLLKRLHKEGCQLGLDIA